MNEIILNTACQPIVSACGFIAASEPFYHLDRIAAFHVILYVTDGTLYVTEDDIDYAVGEGEMLFLKSGVHHLGKRETARGTKWYYAHFRFVSSSEECEPFRPDESSLGLDEPLLLTEVLPKKLTGLRNSGIEKRFAELSDYCRLGDAYKRMRINGMFGSLLTDIALARYMEKKERSLSERICLWLDRHCDEPFRAPRLEAEFYLSYKRMAAVFKKEQGRTMQQYHSERRMIRASYLLRSTLMPISEIADSLGYDDPLYFSKCFHSFYGMSPRSYRLSAQSDY